MIQHDYYTLTEAAKNLGCEVSDLIRFAATGKIRLSIFIDRKGTQTGIRYLLQNHAIELEHYGMADINIAHYKDNGDVLFNEKLQITIDVALITADELEKAKGFIQPEEPRAEHPTGKAKVTISEKPVLTPQDKAEKDKLFRERCYTFLTIGDFIDTVLRVLLGEDEKINTFCSLVAHGLKVYGKGVEGKPVNRDELIDRIKQADADFGKQDDLDFDFWRGLENERKYKVLIEEVEWVYFSRRKDEFPWVDVEGKPVMLPIRVNKQQPELKAVFDTAYEAWHRQTLLDFNQYLIGKITESTGDKQELYQEISDQLLDYFNDPYHGPEYKAHFHDQCHYFHNWLKHKHQSMDCDRQFDNPPLKTAIKITEAEFKRRLYQHPADVVVWYREEKTKLPIQVHTPTKRSRSNPKYRQRKESDTKNPPQAEKPQAQYLSVNGFEGFASGQLEIRGLRSSDLQKEIAKNPRIKSRKNEERATVEEFWDKWQVDKQLYKNVTAFDTAMMDKTGIERRQTIQTWRLSLKSGTRLTG